MAMIVSAYGWKEQSFLNETISSAPAITSKVSTMVLSETHAASAAWPDAFSGHPRGPMVSRVPRRDCCAGQNGPAETHPRTFVQDAMKITER